MGDPRVGSTVFTVQQCAGMTLHGLRAHVACEKRVRLPPRREGRALWKGGEGLARPEDTVVAAVSGGEVAKHWKRNRNASPKQEQGITI